jgi:nucleoside diphosphate kinase
MPDAAVLVDSEPASGGDMADDAGSPQVMPDLSQVALVLLLPDFMRQAVWQDFWRRLAPLSLEIVAATAVRPRPEDVARLYQSNRDRRPAGRVDSLWLGQDMFGVDMSIAVVLRTSLAGEDLTRTLQRWKGPSRYGSRHPGDLREVSPLTNSCASLLHSPEDVRQLERDLRLLFLGGAATRALRYPASRTTTIDDIADFRAYMPPHEEPHPYDIVLRALLRALALLAHDCHLKPSREIRAGQQAARNARSTLAGERGRYVRSKLVDVVREVAAIVADSRPPELVPVEGDELEMALAERLVHDRIALSRMAALLARPDLYGARLARFTVETLERNGLDLDDWERHRLLTAIALFHERAER